MPKLHHLVSPFGELTVQPGTDRVHIRASTPLAGDWGLGWHHAQTAGDEAVFCRAFWRSQLAEGHRPTPAHTELDGFTGQWGFTDDLSLETSRLPAGHRSRVQAYAQGFNQGRRRRSGEAPWTPEDSHLLARTLGFLEWWETRYPQRQFFLQAWQAGLSWARLADLWPGLGPEPPKADWDTVSLPDPFSAEARALVDKIRRFREGPVWVVPGSRTASGRALLGAQYISDVSEPGLPLVSVLVESPDGSVRGLGRPGHPGFLAGTNGKLAWHAVPAVDDSIDLRFAGHGAGSPPGGSWAGAGKTGTLGGLLALEDAETVDQARETTSGLGSASLNLAAVDAQGQAARWAQGPRWQRKARRDEWLPPVGAGEPTAGFRHLAEVPADPGARMTVPGLQERLTAERWALADQALAPLRFLVPETEDGLLLRRWTGDPGPGGQVFERLYAAVLAEFWASSPLVPEALSPVAQALVPVVDRLVQAPHSGWLPSQEKNQRLAEAVRRAFSPGQPPGPPLLSRRAVKACWTEVHGGRKRIFAATVAVTAEGGAGTWEVFLTDDETEVPSFHRW